MAEPATVEIGVRGFGDVGIRRAPVLSAPDRHTTNDGEHPDRVGFVRWTASSTLTAQESLTLPPVSWAVLPAGRRPTSAARIARSAHDIRGRPTSRRRIAS